MLRKGKVQVFANIPEELKKRLMALKEIDSVIYSESRVIGKCIELSLPAVEEHATSPFNSPMQAAPSKRRRLVRA